MVSAEVPLMTSLRRSVIENLAEDLLLSQHRPVGEHQKLLEVVLTVAVRVPSGA